MLTERVKSPQNNYKMNLCPYLNANLALENITETNKTRCTKKLSDIYV